MVNSKEMQAAIIQAAFQAAILVVGTMIEADPPSKPHARKILPEEQHRPRQVEPMLRHPAFNCKAPDRYVEL